jgi:hypothetical protein
MLREPKADPKPEPLSKLQKQLLKKEKSESWKELVKKADRLFSQYIRLRDSDQYGRGKCITCRKIQEVAKGDCGHFISRDELATRWEFKNSNFQCKNCNILHSGRQYEHSIAIDEKYGKGTSEILRIKSKNVFKKDPMVLKIIIQDLETRLEELRSSRGLKLK